MLQHKGLTKLLGLNFDIHNRKGSENSAADALSRKIPGHCNPITSIRPTWDQKVLESYHGDEEATQIISDLTHNPNRSATNQVVNGLLRHLDKLWIRSHGNMRQQLIKTMHASALGGHFGVLATYKRLTLLFYWPSMQSDIQKIIQ